MDGHNEPYKEILLVEDNPDDVELTLRALDVDGIANPIAVAHDGADALDYLFAQGKFAERRGRPLPALVLLDIKLPKIDGLEVLRRLREDERTTLLPVVVLTSSAEESDIFKSYRLRANSFIRKPVDFVQFAAAVKELHLYWLVLNEPPPAKD